MYQEKGKKPIFKTPADFKKRFCFLPAMSKTKKKSLQDMNKIKDPDAEEIAYLRKDIASEQQLKKEVQWNNDELERR